METFNYKQVIILIFTFINLYESSRDSLINCPKLYKHDFKGFVPRGNQSAGNFFELPKIRDLGACVLKCCDDEKCNVAFMNKSKCFLISCFSNEACLPVLHYNVTKRRGLNMVLVRPVDDYDNWEQLLTVQEQYKGSDYMNSYAGRKKLQEAYKDFLLEDSQFSYYCRLDDVNVCAENEICVTNEEDSKIGTCECNDAYVRNADGICIMPRSSELTDMLSDRIIEVTTNRSEPLSKKRLIVSADSKEVKLPNDEVTLVASVSSNEPSDEEPYNYEWTSLEQPKGSTAVKHQNEGQLHLEKLVEGLYTFKVAVSTSTSYGETFVNVTVLPASRINKPPQIVITPANQTIKQPNSKAVLDASSSTDDDKIVSWHWELQQGPLGYQPQLTDNPTLQLNDLTKPGNYTFKLTVTDTDKAISTSLANITVLKFTDYPPEANAGEDKIIYLPHNEITLSGNQSSDDHNITTWEWTKSSDDAQKAVDMQDTRTPYLKLSNLEEGMYTFTLKVTDSAGQSSTAQVHVFVKPPTNKPPIADAGKNVTIILPQTWAILDGGNSKDDNKIDGFKWEQVSGPSTVTFNPSNGSVTNVTSLTKGVYAIKLTVTDNNKNIASNLTYIIVDQNKNQKPVANAGKDFEIELPRNVIYINGSESKDDWSIVKWKWIRDDKSLALGNIAEGSDTTPVLMITDIAVGKYIFNLTVYDEQGLNDMDSVTVTVKHDPKLFHLIEIIVDIDANYITEMQYNTLKGKLALLVPNGSKMIVRNVVPEKGEGRAKITFYVDGPNGNTLSANEVVKYLRRKLKLDASLLGFSVAKLQTSICQNNCSGHGVCIEHTRLCECEAFWMRNTIKYFFYPEEDSDCSWSVLYVVLGVILSAIALIAVLASIIFIFYNMCWKRKRMNKPTNYKLIENTEDLPPFARKNMSDSDTDSDIVFESRVKPGRFSESRNGHKTGRNGYTKMGRRVKT